MTAARFKGLFHGARARDIGGAGRGARCNSSMARSILGRDFVDFHAPADALEHGQAQFAAEVLAKFLQAVEQQWLVIRSR